MNQIKTEGKQYVVTITERAPTPDGTDLNTYHVPVRDLFEASNLIREFEVNFGLLLSITIAPLRYGADT